MPEGYGFITQPTTKPSKEAEEIGKILSEEPPWGYKKFLRDTPYDWSHIAEAVLRARKRANAKDNPFMKER